MGRWNKSEKQDRRKNRFFLEFLCLGSVFSKTKPHLFCLSNSFHPHFPPFFPPRATRNPETITILYLFLTRFYLSNPISETSVAVMFPKRINCTKGQQKNLTHWICAEPLARTGYPKPPKKVCYNQVQVIDTDFFCAGVVVHDSNHWCGIWECNAMGW